MRKLKEVLRLKLDAKLSHERIAAELGISKGVVAKYVGLAAAAGLDWPAVQGLDETPLFLSCRHRCSMGHRFNTFLKHCTEMFHRQFKIRVRLCERFHVLY